MPCQISKRILRSVKIYKSSGHTFSNILQCCVCWHFELVDFGQINKKTNRSNFKNSESANIMSSKNCFNLLRRVVGNSPVLLSRNSVAFTNRKYSDSRYWLLIICNRHLEEKVFVIRGRWQLWHQHLGTAHFNIHQIFVL